MIKEVITLEEWKAMPKDRPKTFPWEEFIEEHIDKPMVFRVMYVDFQKKGGNHESNLRRKIRELVKKKRAEVKYRKKDGKVQAVILIRE